MGVRVCGRKEERERSGGKKKKKKKGVELYLLRIGTGHRSLLQHSKGTLVLLWMICGRTAKCREREGEGK